MADESLLKAFRAYALENPSLARKSLLTKQESAAYKILKNRGGYTLALELAAALDAPIGQIYRVLSRLESLGHVERIIQNKGVSKQRFCISKQ